MRAIDIQFALANSPEFKMRANFLCATNISWGLFAWGEVDYLRVTKSGYCDEIEIKVSKADFNQDKLKKKFNSIWKRDRDQLIRRFYYAVPFDLIGKIEAPEGAGIISVRKRDTDYVVTIEKQPHVNLSARKLNDKELLNIARLQAFRYFRHLKAAL